MLLFKRCGHLQSRSFGGAEKESGLCASEFDLYNLICLSWLLQNLIVFSVCLRLEKPIQWFVTLRWLRLHVKFTAVIHPLTVFLLLHSLCFIVLLAFIILFFTPFCIHLLNGTVHHVFLYSLTLQKSLSHPFLLQPKSSSSWVIL